MGHANVETTMIYTDAAIDRSSNNMFGEWGFLDARWSADLAVLCCPSAAGSRARDVPGRDDDLAGRALGNHFVLAVKSLGLARGGRGDRRDRRAGPCGCECELAGPVGRLELVDGSCLFGWDGRVVVVVLVSG